MIDWTIPNLNARANILNLSLVHVKELEGAIGVEPTFDRFAGVAVTIPTHAPIVVIVAYFERHRNHFFSSKYTTFVIGASGETQTHFFGLEGRGNNLYTTDALLLVDRLTLPVYQGFPKWCLRTVSIRCLSPTKGLFYHYTTEAL